MNSPLAVIESNARVGLGRQYDLVKVIGKGQFSIVYLGFPKSQPQHLIAAKCVAKSQLDKSDKVRELFSNELKVMREVVHQNVLHLEELIETEDSFYVITKYCKNGDMESYLDERKTLPEEEALFFLKQIMSGFVQLHSQKVIHRDFKLANIYLDGHHLIIGDFGFAKIGQVTTASRVGTPFYMAPEVLFGQLKSPYTSKCDLFSIGVVFYRMVYGRLPFPANSLQELENLVEKFSGKNLHFPSTPAISKESKELLSALLEKDPIERISWKLFFNHAVFQVRNLNQFCPASSQDQFFNHSEKNSFFDNSNVDSVNWSVAGAPEIGSQVNTKFEKEREMLSQKNDNDLVFVDPLLFQEASVHNLSFSENQSAGLLASPRERNPKFEQNLLLFLDYYHHERNKCRFMLSTAMSCRQQMKTGLGEDFQEVLLLLAYLLSMKGLKYSNFLGINLLYKRNPLNLEDIEGIVDSPHGKKLLKSLRKDESEFNAYFERLEKLVEEQKVVLRENRPSIVENSTQKDIDPVQIDFMLDRLLFDLFKATKKARMDGELDDPKFSELVKIIGSTEYSIRVDSMFPLKVKQADSKETYFDWTTFKSQQENFMVQCEKIYEDLEKKVQVKPPLCGTKCFTNMCS